MIPPFPDHFGSPDATSRRLICFDMDSTLVRGEMISILADAIGCGSEMHRLTAEAVGGAIDFAASLRSRVALLAGTTRETYQRIAREMPVDPTLPEVVKTLRSRGYTLAIIGGLDIFALPLADRFGFDAVAANVLGKTSDGTLTGTLESDPLDGAAKLARMRELRAQFHVDAQRTAAVGDGFNDLPMLLEAGTGIAFHAVQSVREEVSLRVDSEPLSGILSFLPPG